VLLVSLVSAPTQVFAQTPAPPAPAEPLPLDASSLFAVGSSEWIVTIGHAWGVVVFHSAGGHRYLMQTISWGRILSGPKFPGPLRGRFEWAFEGTPMYAQYHPSHVYGYGVSPLVWRWNFEPRGRYAPFAELSGGALWTSRPVPERTTTANFTAHAGFGTRVLIKRNQALVLEYRFDHVSNGNRLERNPGVNANAVHFGWSFVRPGGG
jgi:hypothetical protein